MNWQQKQLGDIASIITGWTPPPRNTENYGNEISFVSPADLGDKKYIFNTKTKLSTQGAALCQIFPANTILYVCIGSTIGKCGIASTALTSNQQINAVIPSPNYCSEFLYYSLLNESQKIKSQAAEQAVPIINKSNFAATPINLPPLAEQIEIATALASIDALLAKLDQLIAKKRDIKQAAMQELLTGRRRLPGHGNIQWRAIRLGDVLAVRHGKSQHEVVKSGGEYQILASGGEIGRTDHWLYNKPSVLIGRKGTIDNPLYVDRPFWTIDTLFYTEIDTTIAVEKYIYYVFKLIDWRSYNEASGVPSLSSSTISNINFKCPPREEQAEIAALLTDMGTEITALEARREKTRLIKQGMMQELLSGRVRLI